MQANRPIPLVELSNPFSQLSPQRVFVTGATGFIGSILVHMLLDAGHRVTVYARHPSRAAAMFDNRVRCLPSLQALCMDDCFDAVINLAGAPVFGMPWTRSRQRELLDSRIGVTQELVRWVTVAQHKPSTWIQASGIGFYGVRRDDEVFTESSTSGGGFMAELARQWEAAVAPLNAYEIRKVVLRIGVVLGPERGLPLLLLPFRLWLGGRIGSGQQVLSWIHRKDVLAIIAMAMVDRSMHGVYNTVSPGAVRQSDFAQIVGRLLHRPVWFHVPATPLRWLLGEMVDILIAGQRVQPQRLLKAGYGFQFAHVEDALRDLTTRPREK